MPVVSRVAEPTEIDPKALAPEIRRDLRSLSKDTADRVARHLVAAGQLVDTDPERALEHARAAKASAARVGAVREAVGVTAYAAGEWKEAFTELRATVRLTGDIEHLPMIADCERALGRPERALAAQNSAEAARLSPAGRIEMVLVAAGARRDLGQPDAAAVLLLDSDARGSTTHPWTARLRYAYADVLAELGRLDEARQWFVQAADADDEGETDAGDRVLALDGVVLDAVLEPDDPGSDSGRATDDPQPA